MRITKIPAILRCALIIPFSIILLAIIPAPILPPMPRKILNIPELIVEPSNARVGVKTGHGIFCSATFEKEAEVNEAIDLIDSFEGVEYWKDKLPTPLDAEGNKKVLVGRMRKGLSDNRILNFWVVSDNLLKGAALNAVQIASYIVENDSSS